MPVINLTNKSMTLAETTATPKSVLGITLNCIWLVRLQFKSTGKCEVTLSLS